MEVSTAKKYSLALDSSGKVFWWGTISREDGGHKSTATPQQISVGGKKVIQIVSGAEHSFFLTIDFEVFGFGLNDQG